MAPTPPKDRPRLPAAKTTAKLPVAPYSRSKTLNAARQRKIKISYLTDKEKIDLFKGIEQIFAELPQPIFLLPAHEMIFDILHPSSAEVRQWLKEGSISQAEAEIIAANSRTKTVTPEHNYLEYAPFWKLIHSPPWYTKKKHKDVIKFCKSTIQLCGEHFGQIGLAFYGNEIAKRIWGTNKARPPKTNVGDKIIMLDFEKTVTDRKLIEKLFQLRFNNSNAVAQLKEAPSTSTTSLLSGNSAEKGLLEHHQQQEQDSTVRMPKEKQNITDARRAKAETTKRAKLPPIRQGKRSLSAFVDPDRLDDFKAIAAAKGKGVTEHLESLILEDVKANQHLIKKGKEMLKEPKRYRSHAAEVEQENRQLKDLLRRSGMKPQ